MNVSAVYNPTDSYQPITQQDDSAGQPAKRKFMSFDSVMQASNTAQHRTYHVPPGKNVFENICNFLREIKVANSQKAHNRF